MDEKSIEVLKNKIDQINDPELTIIINQLLVERNSLLKDINIDYLTGLYNRKILDFVDNYSVVVMCDIDDFKSINDTYGHDMGDEALKYVSKVLINNVRGHDYVIRYGGDEFLIVFTDCSEEVVINRMKMILKKLRYPIRNTNLIISISAGIAKKMENDNIEDTITRADGALYESKQLGKNIIKVCEKTKQLKLK